MNQGAPEVAERPALPSTSSTAGAAKPAAHGPRGRLWIVVAVLAGIGGAVFFARRSATSDGASGPSGAASASPDARPAPVVVASAEQRDIPIYLEGLGNAVPLATVTVKSQVDGRLDKVLFTEGQRVKKGEALAQVDPRPFVIQLHQAEAALARDGAQSKNAKRNLDRYQTLVGQKLIPQQQVDDQETTFDQAQAAIQSDRATAESARLQLDYARIQSPIDGVTGVRLVDPGNIVHANDASGIVVVTTLDPMAVIFTLPEDDLPRVSKELAAGPLTVEAYSRDAGTRLAVGKVALVDNQVNQATATIRIKALFPNPDNVLWPNAFLKARLLLTIKKGALVVPATAIQRGPQGTFVYLVDAASKANVHPVVVDTTEDEWAILASGLAPGDRVVTEGQNQLRPGAKVAPRAATPPSRDASRAPRSATASPGASGAAPPHAKGSRP
jgi:multidrug efflux system membrane fusion protein